MPIFHFVLKSGWDRYRDLHGEEFANADAARTHARLIARDLLRNSESKARGWRIEVRNEENQTVDEVIFSSLDDRLNELPLPMRTEVERLYESNAFLNDAIADLRDSMRQVKATLARADRLPYLAAVDGEGL